jgi:hypothetical protein
MGISAKSGGIVMKFGSVALALSIAGAVVVGTAQAQTSAAWGVLLNGTDGLQNFDQEGNANWRVMEDGIGASLGNGYLVTKESYRTSVSSPKSGPMSVRIAGSSSAARSPKILAPTAVMK